MRSVLSSPRLRRMIGAYAVNRLGTWLGTVALSLAVYDRTHSALAVAALLFAAQALPAFVVPALIARLEVSRRGRELGQLYLFEALATTSLAVLMWHFWLPAVLVLVALDGTAALAASGLLRAAVARSARAEVELANVTQHAAGPPSDGAIRPCTRLEERVEQAVHNANAALNLAFSITFVLGPVLGGALVAGAGAPAALFIDAGSFLACGALLSDVHAHVEEAAADTVPARLRAALTHIRNAPALRSLLTADAVALVFFAAAGPVEVAYAKTTLLAGDRGYGLLLTVWGAGAVLGGLIFARLVRQPLRGALAASAFAIAIAALGFAVAPSLALACVAALVGGVGNGVEIPSMIGVVQRLTPERLYGRLMGAVESLSALSIALGLPLGGALVAISSPRIAFATIGAGTVGAAIALLHASKRGREAAGDAEEYRAERQATEQLEQAARHESAARG